MHVQARHTGALLPFERDRRLVLRRLPVGAVLGRATLTLTPVSADADGRFLESLTFGAGTGPGSWGASKVVGTGALEVDLHARRRLASLTGSGFAGAPLLVDLGGGFLGLDSNGGFTDGPAFELSNSTELPGVSVTGLRVPAGGVDVSVLRVASPPSNLTLAVAGGPVFWSHFGDLTASVTTPDFSEVVTALLPGLPVANGAHVLELVLHSDSIARLDVTLDVEFTLAVAPAQVRTVRAQYAFDGVPSDDGGRLVVAVPAGAVVAGTTGQVLGAFAATQVVHGPVTAAAAVDLVALEAGGSLAQPLAPAAPLVATSVDLLVTSVSAQASLAVGLFADDDGKPGRTALLPRPAELVINRDTAGAPTWLNVALPGELELPARRVWLVVQATAGRAAWSAAPGPADEGGLPGPALQQTRDGGLSWRAVDGAGAAGAAGAVGAAGIGAAAALRLRHATTGFRMPLELRAGGGGQEVAVSLQRFAPSGAVDFSLDFPEVADALNTALSSAGGGPDAGEEIANGDFGQWYRVGQQPVETGRLSGAPEVAQDLAVVAPDGAEVFVVGHRFVDDAPVAVLTAYETYSRRRLLRTDLGAGEPLAVAIDPGGRRLIVSIDARRGVGLSSSSVTRGALVVVDAATGRPLGEPIVVPDPVTHLAPAADGLGVYLAGVTSTESGRRTVVRHLDWALLEAAATGGPLPADIPADDVPGVPVALATGIDGLVAVLTRTPSPSSGADEVTHLFVYDDRAAVGVGDRREATPDVVEGARGVACAPGQVLVLTAAQVRYLDPGNLEVGARVGVGGPNSPASALALDATGGLAVVVGADAVTVLDVAARRTSAGRYTLAGDGDPGVAVSPPGTHAVLTRPFADAAVLITIGDPVPVEWELTAGQVRPIALPTGRLMALIGDRPVALRQAPVPAPAPAPGLRQTAKPGAVAQSALAQVVPVVGGARYRFAFDGVALVEGASAQVRWIGDACGVERVDRVPVSVFDTADRSVLERVPHHEAVLTAPAGARSAEVRFHAAESYLLVDDVSLAGSADVAGTTWSPVESVAAGALTSTPTDGGATFTNGGAAPSELAQVVGVSAGDTYELTFRAVTTGAPGARLEVRFADEATTAVGQSVVLEVDELDLDAHGATGTVPAGAVEAILAIVVPPGAALTLTDLHLRLGSPTEVEVYLASEAPGEVSLTGVGVVLEEGPTAPAPVPPEGLCPPTPPGSSEDGTACYCRGCGRTAPVPRAPQAISTAGRPVSVGTCTSCGTGVVRTGGRVVGRAGGQPTAVALPMFRLPARTPATGPALVAEVMVEASLEEVEFIGPARAAALVAAGVPDVVALAGADPTLVATLPGVSTTLAPRIIAAAAALVRARGSRVLLGL
ncbi:helix-hairpin-helix domain-containing protein [Occultella kanbiaonis]|uniref:helix-hairpin-helix domain-containing protein n=1 Tax=Occultella kanbiaonis TaxID=2675754 RepID=UPI0012B8FB21|nr:helix-hairpin-helix domain-containing protein [Occultella kanbiaonis]